MGLFGIQCVLFDLYGTLLDVRVDQESPQLWAGIATALRGAGLQAQPEYLERLFTTELRDERSRHPDGFVMDVVFRRLLATIGSKLSPAEFGGLFRKLSIKKLTLRPYVPPLLRRLRESGCKTGVVSNTEAILTRFDLSCFPALRDIDIVLLSSEVGIKKPDPGIFNHALKDLGCGANTAVFIGDNLTEDISGAKAVGMKTIYLSNDDEAMAAISSADCVLPASPTVDEFMLSVEKLGSGIGCDTNTPKRTRLL